MSVKVAIQLWSVNQLMKEDPFGTINEVAKLGYKYIEPANHDANHDDGVGFGVPAEEFKKILEQYGSKVVSAHVDPLSVDNYRRAIAYNKVIGNNTLVEGMGNFFSEKDVYDHCELYNKVGKMLYEEGMRFLYHNHHHEFQTIKGKTIYDIIVENTDPKYVGFELDTFWAARGGADPVKEMKKLGNRLNLVHQKDFAKDSPNPIDLLSMVGYEFVEREAFEEELPVAHFKSCFPKDLKRDSSLDFVEIGTGTMDIQGIIDAANEIGSVEYIVLEQDATTYNQLESIKISMDAFRKFTGIEWD